MKNKVHLITYADGFGQNLSELKEVLDKYFKKEIRGVHILPPYPSSADRGFAPLTHMEIDPKFGTWDDVKAIAEDYELMMDFMVNHISSESKYFKDYLKNGKKSKYNDYFITLDKFLARREKEKIDSTYEGVTGFARRVYAKFRKSVKNDLEKIYRPRTGTPFHKFKFEDGTEDDVWCTFSKDQVDLDVENEKVQELFKKWFENLAKNGTKCVRLDALGYVIKRRGTSSFMIPETYNFVNWFGEVAHKHDMEILPEIHSRYEAQLKLADQEKVDYIYDFSISFLILHAIFSGNARQLKNWLRIRPDNQITTLDTHDGIGVIDVEGLLEEDEVAELSKKIFSNGGNATMRASGTSSDNVDIYQINITYFSALGADEQKYLIARAIQFFTPGIPQIYSVGLLAGKNDEERLNKTGIGRSILRHAYTKEEVAQEVKRPVVKKLLELIRFRNDYEAFEGKFKIKDSSDEKLILKWEKENYKCQLDVDFKKLKAKIVYKEGDKDKTIIL